MGCSSMERIGKLYTSKNKAENSNLPLIHTFLNKHVKVKIEGNFEVSGVLICYQMENKTLHKPSVLILKNGDGFHVLRGNFENISEAK
jgi:small nuclear ribonucleoprotein (snRNP)-like protein